MKSAIPFCGHTAKASIVFEIPDDTEKRFHLCAALQIAVGNHADLGGADLHEAYLRGANLHGANLSGANLRGADLGGADLGGADLRGANLSGANLRGANLRCADLRGANLRGANLRCADLGGADLRGANLHGANLSGANLRGADLGGANLHGADLHEAYLRGADLHGADLRCADLHEAYLRGANLHGANLSGANLEYRSLVPDAGAFTAYKKLKHGVIATLEIPAEARRISSLVGRKCRAEFAMVIAISGDVKCGKSKHDGTPYVVGRIVRPDSFDDDIRVECTHGIHFFITRKEAEEYEM